MVRSGSAILVFSIVLKDKQIFAGVNQFCEDITKKNNSNK